MRQDGHDFSCTLVTNHIPAGGTRLQLSATDAERAALAERFGVVEIKSFDASVTLEHVGDGKVRMRGNFAATVVQTCGVTLEAFPDDIREDFDLTFKETAADKRRETEYVIDMDDDCEPMENGEIDVGETVSELLSLALDDFPKKKDAVFSFADDDVAEEEVKSPFSVLKTLKKE